MEFEKPLPCYHLGEVPGMDYNPKTDTLSYEMQWLFDIQAPTRSSQIVAVPFVPRSGL